MMMKCPLCRYQRFYLKDPDDEYETYGFSCESGDICFDPELNESEIPELSDDTHIYCDNCAWNGTLSQIKN